MTDIESPTRFRTFRDSIAVILPICGNTFLQTIRQPVYTVVLLVTFLALSMTLFTAGYTMSTDYHASDQQLFQDLGLATLRVSGLLIAAFSAASVLRREIEEKTALTVITKPVSRAAFVAGKFGGVAAAAALAYYLCSLVFLMAVRHHVRPARYDPFDWPVIVLGGSALLLAVMLAALGNWLFRWTFTSGLVWMSTILLTAAMLAIGFIGKGWAAVPFGDGIPAQVLLELAMMFLAVVIFAALAVTASTRLGETLTLLVCVAVFLLGSAHPLIIRRWGDSVPILRVVGWVLPNFSYFYPQDDLAWTGKVPLSLLGSAALYCLMYSSGILALGIGLFQTRELEAAGGEGGTPAMVSLAAWSGRAAAVVAACAALVLITTPRYHSLPLLALAGGLLPASGAAWVLWGAFGRGAKWSFWAVLVLHTLAGGAAAAAWAWPGLLAESRPIIRLLVPLAAASSAAVLLAMALPRTRRHFGFRA